MFESEGLDVTVLDSAGAAAWVSAAHARVVAEEAVIFELAAHWADLHPPAPAPGVDRRGREGARPCGGEGTPEVAEFAPAELGVRLATTTGAAAALMADALDTRHRLPRLWARVRGGGVRVWQARKVAQATRHLGAEAATCVDRAVADTIGLVSWNRLDTLLAAAVISADPALAEQRARMWEATRFVRAGRNQEGLRTLVARAAAGDVSVFLAVVDRIAEILAAQGDTEEVGIRRSKAIGILAQPEAALRLLWNHRADAPDPELPPEPSLDADGTGEDEDALRSDRWSQPPPVHPDRMRPRVVLYMHLSEEALTAGAGVARVEGCGPWTVGQLARFVAGSRSDLRVQPVIDLNDTVPPVDAYEVPDRLRERYRLRSPASGFPFSPTTSRRMDLDHTRPYVEPACGGPPGQTGLGNLAPLSRREHRLKTHSRWRVRQPSADTLVWRTPYGAHFLVTPAGTISLGDGRFARAVWRAADSTADARPIGALRLVPVPV